MNERIKFLAEQAGFKSKADVYDRNQAFDIEKFANLIVKEAMDQCRQEWYELNNIESKQTDPRMVGIRVGKKAGVNKCLHRIAKHFGVGDA